MVTVATQAARVHHPDGARRRAQVALWLRAHSDARLANAGGAAGLPAARGRGVAGALCLAGPAVGACGMGALCGAAARRARPGAQPPSPLRGGEWRDTGGVGRAARAATGCGRAPGAEDVRALTHTWPEMCGVTPKLPCANCAGE
eukprot:361182-Chlamydomonas_euryale.AAC.6